MAPKNCVEKYCVEENRSPPPLHHTHTKAHSQRECTHAERERRPRPPLSAWHAPAAGRHEAAGAKRRRVCLCRSSQCLWDPPEIEEGHAMPPCRPSGVKHCREGGTTHTSPGQGMGRRGGESEPRVGGGRAHLFHLSNMLLMEVCGGSANVAIHVDRFLSSMSLLLSAPKAPTRRANIL